MVRTEQHLRVLMPLFVLNTLMHEPKLDKEVLVIFKHIQLHLKKYKKKPIFFYEKKTVGYYFYYYF
jgi:hypothetical protein